MLLGVVVVVLVVGDLLARAYVETGVEASLREELHDVGSVDADISSFPFVGRIIVGGEVRRVRFTLTDVGGHELPVAALRLTVDGLRFDRSSLVNHSRLRVTGVDSVRVTAVVSADAMEALLGPAAGALDLAEGASVRIAGGRVELPGGLSIPVPPVELLPCDASATIVERSLVFECVADRLPAIVVAAIGSVDLREELTPG